MLRAIFGLCLVAALYGTASAAPISYTLTGNFSGSLNGAAFRASTGTLSGIGDTAGAITVEPYLAYNPLTLTGFSIEGVGAGIIITPLRVFAADNVFGFSRLDGSDVQDVTARAFFGYNLSTELGPVTGSPFAGGVVATTAGTLQLLADTATVTVRLIATPEPASLSLLLAGLTACGLYRRLGSERRAMATGSA
jgi:hypothetical protein